MNSIKAIQTDYFRSSRTIETVLVSNKTNERVYFVYNYEGYSFRVFDSQIKLLNFFQNSEENCNHFENEGDLDNFLTNIELNKIKENGAKYMFSSNY
jgi:hypothetical protein